MGGVWRAGGGPGGGARVEGSWWSSLVVVVVVVVADVRLRRKQGLEREVWRKRGAQVLQT